MLSVPGARRFFAAACLGRLGLAMTGLGLLWVVQSEAGLVVAGTVTGGFALAEAVAAPQVARLVDRFGQTRTVPVVATGHLVGVAGVLLALHQDRTWLVALAAAVAGGFAPSFGAYAAVRWNRLLDDESRLVAYALEATANDVAFLLGPALVVAVAARSPTTALLLATAAVVGGALVLGRLRGTAPPARKPAPVRSRPDRASRLVSAPFPALLLLNGGLGAFFGAAQLTVTAAAQRLDRPAWGGVLYAALSLASVVGGAAFGARAWRTPPARLLLPVAGWFTGAVVLLALTGAHLVGLALGLVAAGLAVAPLLTLSATLLTRHVPSTRLTQAFVWTGSASAAGLAAGAAVTGRVLADDGPGFVVAVAAAALVAGAAVILGVTSATPTSGSPERR